MITQTLDKFTKEPASTIALESSDKVRVILLQDGRRLAYQEYGDRRGFPLFHCHSHGSSRKEAALFDRAAKSAGFRLISIDRPGTGFSDFRPGGAPQTFAQDLVDLADSLGCRKFGVMACGGGAAYALAACDHVPERAKLMLGISCVPPRTMGLLRKVCSKATRIIAELMRLYIALRHRLCSRNPQCYLDRLSDTLCYSDRRMLQQPQTLELMQTDIEESMRQGARGVAYDISQSYAEWGFDLRRVTAPVLLWQGTADTLVSQHCTEKFASSLPNATLHRVVNRGHFFFLRAMDEIFSAANFQLQNDGARRNNLVAIGAQKKSKKVLTRAVI